MREDGSPGWVPLLFALAIPPQPSLAPRPGWPEEWRLAEPLHLDLGCGPGRFGLRLAQARPGLNVLGVENRRFLVERARQSHGPPRTTGLRFLDAPFPSR